MSKKLKKQVIHEREGDIYFFVPETQNWEPLYAQAIDGRILVYKNKEKEVQIVDKTINLWEVEGVSSSTKTKGIRNFSLILSVSHKIQLGFPKKNIMKEWSAFLKNEFTYWKVKKKNDENPLLSPTKTAPISEPDFFVLERPKTDRTSIWQKAATRNLEQTPKQGHYYKQGEGPQDFTPRGSIKPGKFGGSVDDQAEGGVQNIIENEDEEKFLMNENALYRHVRIGLMPLRMQEVLRAVGQRNNSLFKITARDKMVMHEKGVAIFCAQERKAASWLELLKFSKSFKTLKANWNQVWGSSYLWSYKAFSSVNQPVLDVFNSLMHFESYPFWNPATPNMRILLEFPDGNTVLSERTIKLPQDYLEERTLYVLSTPVTIISGKQCFYIIETSVPFEPAGTLTGAKQMPAARMPISVIEVREHPTNKDRTMVSQYMQFDPNVAFYKSARHSQAYGIELLRTTFTALISDLMDSPYGRNVDDKLNRIVTKQAVLGYSLKNVANRTNFISAIDSKDEEAEVNAFEVEKQDVPEGLEGLLGNIGSVAQGDDEQVKQRPRRDQDNLDAFDMEDEEEGCAEIFTKMFYTLDPKAGLIFTNKSIISKQRKALSYMLKRLGLAIFTGKGINSISLPANLFQPSTYLVRLAIEFQFAPVFIERAAKEKDPVEQLKQIMCFALASMLLTLSMEKPFNPILGETFEARVGSDCHVALEQISHHPPISAVQVDSTDYFCDGHFEYRGDNGANSLNASKVGHLRVHMRNTGLDYYVTYPTCKISGTMFGRRTFNYNGMLKIVCEQAGIQGFIIYNPDIKGALKSLLGKKQRADYFRGGILNDLKFEPSKKNLHKVPDEITVSTIEGIWTQHIEFDGNRYWDINLEKPVKLDQLGETSLLSDSSRRQDMLEVIRQDFQSAQVWKEKLENLQRADRKARAKFGKLRKKAEKKKK